MPALDLFASAPDMVGYVGAATVAAAYFLNQRRLLNSEDWRFPAINLAGSLLIMVSLIDHPNLPSVGIEVFWSSISVYGVWRNVRATRNATGHR